MEVYFQRDASEKVCSTTCSTSCSTYLISSAFVPLLSPYNHPVVSLALVRDDGDGVVVALVVALALVVVAAAVVVGNGVFVFVFVVASKNNFLLMTQ